jgi:hypothetical protein
MLLHTQGPDGFSRPDPRLVFANRLNLEEHLAPELFQRGLGSGGSARFRFANYNL